MEKVTTWAGLDVHAARIVIATLKGQGREPEVRDILSDPKVARRTLHRLLGIACEVIAPWLIPVKAGDRVKTDRCDAQKLARLYRAGELTAVTVPSASQEATRDLVRARDDVRKDLTAARHRLGKLLIRHGRHFASGENWTLRFWAWASKLDFEREGERLTFEHYVAEVNHRVERRAAIDRDLERIAATEPYAAPVRRLACLRGISTLSALALLVEIGDFRRFETPRQLMAYIGLVPREHSGGKEKRGGITRTGNGHVRRLLVEAAWSCRHRPAIGERGREALQGQPAAAAAVARRAQERLHRRYGRLVSRGRPSQVAITAVARELCAFTWSLMAA